MTIIHPKPKFIIPLLYTVSCIDLFFQSIIHIYFQIN